MRHSSASRPTTSVPSATPILRGRAFTSGDTAASPLVAIVNRAFAKRYFNGDALGKRFNRMVAPPNQLVPNTIVGIVEDVRHNGIERQLEPEFYLPESQSPSTDVNILLRSTADPILLANAMRQAVLAVDPQLPLFDVQTMEQRVSDQVAQRRLIMLLIACFRAARRRPLRRRRLWRLRLLGLAANAGDGHPPRPRRVPPWLARPHRRAGRAPHRTRRRSRHRHRIRSQQTTRQHVGRHPAARCPLVLTRLDSHDSSRARRQHHPRIPKPPAPISSPSFILSKVARNA